MNEKILEDAMEDYWLFFYQKFPQFSIKQN